MIYLISFIHFKILKFNFLCIVFSINDKLLMSEMPKNGVLDVLSEI